MAHEASALEELRARISAEAQGIVGKQLPLKIQALDEVYRRCKSLRTKLAQEIDTDPAVTAIVHQGVRDAIVILKKQIRDMLTELSTLRLWIRLQMPRMEDGNNFGVEVQEEILSMVNG